ncbi:MAG: response regulator [Candidatus Omnitrophota bacterium]
MAAKNDSIKVLIVEDDDYVRESTVFMLKEMGFSVQAAKNGREALNKISRNKPDTIVLDVAMPVMDGIETCKRLRERPDTQNIPVIFLSAQSRVEPLIAGMPGPAIKCMEKPCDIKCIAEEIRLAALHR